jgi:prepilin-type N-terminal cleavage/methylation domain-containing protein
MKRDKKKGFTLLEVMVVVAIVGIATALSYPNISNTLEERQLELSAREISSTIQTARFLAITAKNRHRVRFWAYGGTYGYTVESETSSGWASPRGTVARRIPIRFAPVLSLPSSSDIIFDGLGLVDNFDGAKNTITLSSRKLSLLGQLSKRIVRLFATGTVEVATAS